MVRRTTVTALALLLLTSASTAAAPGGLPAAVPFGPALREQLSAVVGVRDRSVPPRTRHVDADGEPLYTNRLLLEASPYLQQHAHNPVDWQPWGEEAFARARELGRPVFLSIGYSTCHWCHVMEDESFDDIETARLLNARFVAIKVDREARPDVDAVYMAAIHALGETGGWPLNVFLTPDRKPFFAGTYFPPSEQSGRPSFRRVLATVADQWRDQPASLQQTAAVLSGRIETLLTGESVFESRAIPDGLPEQAVLAQLRRFDPEWGGLGSGMKFPSSFSLRLAMRVERDLRARSARSMESPDAVAEALRNADAIRRAVVRTLDRMAAGGIRDHLAGGFHRYATDRRWLVPHFEKMLYDNALLARVYSEAWQWSGDERYAEVARDTLEYLDREMSAPGGGFYSATDADSRGPSGEMEEGYYFTWTPGELREVLGAERARTVAAWYGVNDAGNFEGRTILHTWREEAVVAAELGSDVAVLRSEIARARPLLRAAREGRPAPLRDDKVVTAWNGLAISAFARAGFALGESRWTERAVRAARFALESMQREGRLQRVSFAGKASVDAFLEDHVALAEALIDLFEADGDPHWLHEAVRLQSEIDGRFADPQGGYFRVARTAEQLLARDKPRRDGALPAGNAVAASVLWRLAELTGDASSADRATRLLASFAAELEASPSAFGELLLAFELRSGAKEIVLVGPEGGDAAVLAPMLAPLRRNFVTARVLAATFEGERQARLAEIVTLVERKPARAGKVTAYVCEARVCQLPTTDPAVLARQLGIQTVGEP